MSNNNSLYNINSGDNRLKTLGKKNMMSSGKNLTG